MFWALRFGFRMGVVSINAIQVCWESLPNFNGENPQHFAFSMLWYTSRVLHLCI